MVPQADASVTCSNLYVRAFVAFHLRPLSKEASQLIGIFFTGDCHKRLYCGALEHLMIEERPEQRQKLLKRFHNILRGKGCRPHD